MERNRVTIHAINSALFLFVLLFCNIMSVYAQEPVSKRFISVEGVTTQIFREGIAGAERTSNYKNRAMGLDTLELIKEAADFYQVKYFSAAPSVEEGWLKKEKGQKIFLVSPLYSLRDRYTKRVNVPSHEERLVIVLSHPEWQAVSRFVIADGCVVSGMNQDMVMSCFGAADEHVRYFTSIVRADQWIYYLSQDKDFRLTFENERLMLFEDKALLSSKEAKEDLAFQKQGYYYPYRTLSLKMLLGGTIAMIAGYNGITRQRIYSKSTPFRQPGDPLFTSKNNTGNWLLVGVGFAAQALGGILFNYSPDAKIIIKKMTSGSGNLPMIGIGIPITLGRK